MNNKQQNDFENNKDLLMSGIVGALGGAIAAMGIKVVMSNPNMKRSMFQLLSDASDQISNMMREKAKQRAQENNLLSPGKDKKE